MASADTQLPQADSSDGPARLAFELPRPDRQTEPAVQAGSSSTTAKTAVQDLAREFDELVAPLEQRTGQRLNEPNRSFCLSAFVEHPEGFRQTVVAAGERSQRTPIGLLVRMVRDRDHEVLDRPAAPAPRCRLFVHHTTAEGRDETIVEDLDDVAACEHRADELRTTHDVYDVEILEPVRRVA